MTVFGIHIVTRGRPLPEGNPVRLWLDFRLLPYLAALVMRVLVYTLRVRYENEGPVQDFVAGGERFILAFYHRRLVAMPASYPFRRCTPLGEPRGVAILSSDSRDGERSTIVWKFFGIESIRGTATHGGAQALVKLIRAVKDGWDLGMAVDGPQGPPRKVKPGTLAISRKTGAWIVPVCVAYERAWTLGTWDSLLLPMPFSGLVVNYGEPFRVEGDEEPYRARLERELDAMEGWAESTF